MGVWATTEAAIYAWVSAALPGGWTAIFAEQNGSVPETNFVTIRLGDVRALGAIDEPLYAGNAGSPPNDVTITEIGWRELDVSIQAFGVKGTTTGDNSPRAVLSAVRQQLEFPAVRAALLMAGMAPFDDRQPVRNVATVAGTIFEPRAIFEVRFYLFETATATTTYIETVDAGPVTPGPQQAVPGTVTYAGQTIDYPE